MSSIDPDKLKDMPEVRISPDLTTVAIRTHPTPTAAWRVSNGGYYHDDMVTDWLRMDIDPDDIQDDFGL